MKPITNAALSRRSWLKQAALAPPAVSSLAAGVWADQAARKPLPVAGVVTVYRNNTHADVIIGKILDGFRQDGGPGPALKLESLYVDQVAGGDMSRDLAQKHGFRLAKTIDEAITLGTDKLQVAGVVSVGEHGKYPSTPDTNQRMYPRRRFFDEIVATFRRTGSVVPVFSDKHLAYNTKDARHMYQTARQLKIPFMAGSSLPVAWRDPPLALPLGCEIEEALAVGYGGLESYGFHALEMLACMVERRKGGERGVKGVQAVQGEQIWKTEQQGRWSRELLEAAVAALPESRPGKPEERLSKGAAIYLIDYRDGLKANVAMAQGLARRFGVALKLRDQRDPMAVFFRLEEEKPYGHFAYLVKAIEHMVHTGRPAYPVERTYLTTGVLDAVMHSLAADGKRIATPDLDVPYRAVDWRFANQA